MTIGRAIDYLIGEYFDAMCEERIQKPVSYALYRTWQWADGKEKPRGKVSNVGQWIEYEVHGHPACKCSVCNNDVSYPCKDKFCKHCGAKMEVQDADCD